MVARRSPKPQVRVRIPTPSPHYIEHGSKFYLTCALIFCIIYIQILNRRISLAWTEEQKELAVEKYTSANPTAETSVDIVAEIADEMGESVNGVRMVLIKKGVYVKKEPAKKSETTKSTGTRVSKDEAHAQLTEAIENAGKEADSDIISKLTGKAALYFASVIGG